MRLRFRILTVCLAAVECLSITGPASAFPVPVSQPAAVTAAAESPLLTQVQMRDRRHRRDRVIRRWDRQQHGRRCRYRDGGCRNYYQGYYYVNPWWLLPPVIGGGFYNDYYGGDYSYYSPRPSRVVRYGRRHVRWCYSRYQSYNQRNNTWITNSGRVRQCISPFI